MIYEQLRLTIRKTQELPASAELFWILYKKSVVFLFSELWFEKTLGL